MHFISRNHEKTVSAEERKEGKDNASAAPIRTPIAVVYCWCQVDGQHKERRHKTNNATYRCKPLYGQCNHVKSKNLEFAIFGNKGMS